MSTEEIQRILYPVSLGCHTRPVFRQALSLATLYRSELTLLHVLEPMGEMGRLVIERYLNKRTLRHLREDGITELTSQMREQLRTYLNEELKALNLTNAPVNINLVISEGQPEHVILQQIKLQDADMIVIGANNSFGQHSSLTHQIIQYIDIPAMVVPAKQRSLKWR